MREFAPLNELFDKANSYTIVLAPLNSAMSLQPRKAWEDPADYRDLGEHAYTGDEGRDRAQRNRKRFVGAHVLPIASGKEWKEGEKVKTLEGGEVWWENADAGGKVVSSSCCGDSEFVRADLCADTTWKY